MSSPLRASRSDPCEVVDWSLTKRRFDWRMPKRSSPSVVQRQLPRASPYADGQSPASLVQCARRRLQYSQLPVRCSARRAAQQQQQHHQHQSQQVQERLASSVRRFPVLCAATPKRCVSAKSCPPEDGAPRLPSAVNSPGRRSLSMVNLTSVAASIGDFEPADLCSDSNSAATTARLDDAQCESLESMAERQEARELHAGRIVWRSLVVNAWRRRREEIAELRLTLEALGQQHDQLQLQIVVLRKLLDKENARVSSLAGELHRAKANLEEVTRERDQIRVEKEVAQGEAQRQREISEERSVTVENLRNELKTSQDQLDALERQINKDREKLLKLREDKKILLEKVSSSESLAAEREARLEKAELTLEEAQMQLATQNSLTSSLQEEVHRFLNALKEKEDEKTELERMLEEMREESARAEGRLRASEETERALSCRAADLERQLAEQEAKIKCIEAAYNAQALELNELRERLHRQTQESGWSSRVLQLAGSVVRAPGVILRTLHFFSSGVPLNF